MAMLVQEQTVMDARRLLAVAQAEEDALEILLEGSILEITLRTGTEAMTIPVTPEVGWAVVHELLLAAIDKREELEQTLRSLSAVEVQERGLVA